MQLYEVHSYGYWWRSASPWGYDYEAQAGEPYYTTSNGTILHGYEGVARGLTYDENYVVTNYAVPETVEWSEQGPVYATPRDWAKDGAYGDQKVLGYMASSVLPHIDMLLNGEWDGGGA